MTTESSLPLGRFLLRSWLVHIIFTITFIVVLIVVRSHYSDTSATRTDFLINLISLPLCWTHTVLLLVFSMRRFSRKQTIPGVIYLAQFLASGVIGYYLYVILALFGWAYTMKGH